MKTFKVTLGRFFHGGQEKTITIKAKSNMDAIHKLAWRTYRGLLPKDSSLRSIIEVEK